MKNNSIYHKLSDEVQEKICALHPDFMSDNAIRRDAEHDRANLWRPAYVRDVEKIMNIPYYNRYADKTQVFSFCKNDDISRRAFHVQLVSRIARNIGRLLGLDLDLLEAIALGHDIGHTPFGHAGERVLNELYYGRTGRYFNHNVHSVRVLDKIFKLNISLQTLDGILCHNGEFALKEYRPSSLDNFEEFDEKVEECYTDKKAIKRLIPCTLEGCVVRICDMIAYVGKDRQDAVKMNIIPDDSVFDDSKIGRFNAAMINNLIVNIVENSFGKDYLALDGEYFDALVKSKRDNSRLIYQNPALEKRYKNILLPMFERIYERLRKDLTEKKTSSVIFVHHINYINECNKYRGVIYGSEETADDIVTDFIASMTDDYIIDLYSYLFGKPSGAEYVSYFINLS